MTKAVRVTKAKLAERDDVSSKERARDYTFRVLIEGEMQFTFNGLEVQTAAGEGDPSGFEPTDKALADLQHEVLEHLGLNYAVTKLELSTDSDLLLGAKEPESEHKPSLSRAKKTPKEETRHSMRKK